MAQPKKQPTSSTTTVEESAFSFPNRKLVIKLIPKRNKFISEQRTNFNPYTKGIGDRSVHVFELPLRSSGGYVNPFNSIAEREAIESAMGYDFGHISVENQKSQFWENFKLRLDKRDLELNLSKAEDYLKYLVANQLKDFVAPEGINPRSKETYRFQIIDESKEELEALQSISYTQKAYMEFGKISENPTLLRYILIEKQGGSRLPTKQFDYQWLVKQVDAFVKDDPRHFLNIVQKDFLELRSWVHDAVMLNVIDRTNNLYYTKDGLPLALKERTPNIDGVVEFLNDDRNQDLYLALQEQVEKARE